MRAYYVITSIIETNKRLFTGKEISKYSFGKKVPIRYQISEMVAN